MNRRIDLLSMNEHWHLCPTHGWEECDGSTISHACNTRPISIKNPYWRDEIKNDIIK